MEHQVTYVGIDVSKVRVDVAVRPSGDGWSVNYDESGVAALVVHWQAMNPAPVLLEASGGMEIPMVSALAAAALPVVVVNPRQVRDFAKATGRLAKTGALDAQVLAHFGEGVRPASRPIRDSESQELNELTTRRNQLMTMLVTEKNRLGQASRTVRPGMQAHVRWLEKELDDLDNVYATRCVAVRHGGRRMTRCARFPGWANSSPCRSWHICRNWVHWTESRLLRSSVWRPSIGTAE